VATNPSREIDENPVNFPETESQASLDSIYRQYGERVLNLAYRMTSDAETARDLTHDVFLKVHENLGSFEGDSHVYTWIYRIAVNHILNHLRRARRAKWVRLLDENVADLVTQDRPVINGGVGDSADFVQAIEHHERSKVLWSAVQSLPPKFRMPLVLFFYEGLSHQEIAEVMSLSLSAVETRIHRAKKALFGKIQPYLTDL
jgi:RNA polymerase sigma-70 factor (ECF subfamily)